MAQAITLGDGQPASEHNKQAGPRFTRGKQALATPERQYLAKTLHARDVGCSQHRKHLVAPAGVGRKRGDGGIISHEKELRDAAVRICTDLNRDPRRRQARCVPDWPALSVTGGIGWHMQAC
jgi:hypothetical protein